MTVLSMNAKSSCAGRLTKKSVFFLLNSLFFKNKLLLFRSLQLLKVNRVKANTNRELSELQTSERHNLTGLHLLILKAIFQSNHDPLKLRFFNQVTTNGLKK